MTTCGFLGTIHSFPGACSVTLLLSSDVWSFQPSLAAENSSPPTSRGGRLGPSPCWRASSVKNQYEGSDFLVSEQRALKAIVYKLGFNQWIQEARDEWIQGLQWR